jgi:excinuclease UvrABC nuclease subunit
MIIRGGRNLGSTCYFPKGALAEPNEALASFLMQYYDSTPPPPEVLVNLELAELEPLAEALRARAEGSLRIWRPSRALPARWMSMTEENAAQALRMRRARRATAETPGMFRHQPHGGRGDGGLLRGVRFRGTHKEGVPPVQHRGGHAR